MTDPILLPSPASRRRRLLLDLSAVAGLFVLLAFVEYAMGRIVFSKSGKFLLWVGDRDGPETSQQLTDWYSLTHITHGFILYGIVWLCGGRKASPDIRVLLVIVLEAAWEIFENSSFTINRFRQATMAVGYTGDTILNSESDLLCCTIGALLARMLPLPVSVAIVLILEGLPALVIRDNLTLDAIMLMHPFEAIKHWQAGVH